MQLAAEAAAAQRAAMEASTAAQGRMKIQADKKRREADFTVG